MIQYTVTDETRQVIERKNEQRAASKKPQKKHHLWNLGPFELRDWKYWGFKLSGVNEEIEQSLHEPMEQDDLLLLIGHAMHLRNQQKADIKKMPTPLRGQTAE